MNIETIRPNLFLSLALACTLAACGGGGGGESNSGSAANTPAAATPAPAPAPEPEPTPEPAPEPTPEALPEAEPQEPISYIPDEQRLNEEAEDSSNLYVEEGFLFDASQMVTITISGIYPNGSPLANTIIRLSSVDESVTGLDQEAIQDAQVLLIGKLNDAGTFNRQVEWPPNIRKVLLDINALGVENEVLLDIDDGYVTYQIQ